MRLNKCAKERKKLLKRALANSRLERLGLKTEFLPKKETPNTRKYYSSEVLSVTRGGRRRRAAVAEQ